MANIALGHRRSVAHIVVRFALDVGMIPLTGTRDPEHMQSDLDIFDFRLEPNEVDEILQVAMR